jgi:hypothetical protein
VAIPNEPKPHLPIRPTPPAAPDVTQDPIDQPIQDPQPGREAPHIPRLPGVGDPLPDDDKPAAIWNGPLSAVGSSASTVQDYDSAGHANVGQGFVKAA